MIPKRHVIFKAIYCWLYFDSIFSGFTQADATDRANQAIDTELSRQQRYIGTGIDTLNTAIRDNSADSANQTLAQGKAEALDSYRNIEKSPYVTGGKTYSGEDAFTTKANTKAYTKRTNEAKAENQSYSNLANAQQISAYDTASKLRLNAMKSAASAAPLSNEITDAESSANNTWIAELGQVGTATTDNGIYKSSASQGVGDLSSNSGIYSSGSGSSSYSLGGSPSYTGGTSTGGSD